MQTPPFWEAASIPIPSHRQTEREGCCYAEDESPLRKSSEQHHIQVTRFAIQGKGPEVKITTEHTRHLNYWHIFTSAKSISLSQQQLWLMTALRLW